MRMQETDNPSNRRGDLRALCSELVEITFLDQRGRRITEVGLVEDVASQGIRVSLSLPVTPGLKVRFKVQEFRGEAAVRYCELSDTGYAIGLEFSEESGLRSLDWSPSHLLRLPSS